MALPTRVIAPALFAAALCIPSSAQQLYSMRWVKVGPADGQPWSTPWLPNQRQAVCGHSSGCSCFGQNKCGTYPAGSTTLFWPNGCSSRNWAIQCQAQVQAAAPAPTYPLPVYPAPVNPQPGYSTPSDLCPKNVGASQPAPIHPGDSPYLQCQVRAHNDEIVCEQNSCPLFRCGDSGAAYAYGQCIRTKCDTRYQAAIAQCSAMYGRR